MSGSLLTLNVADKRFQSRRIIDGVSFDIRPGEIVSLLGPSGCGKSTLLRIVAGLDTDYRGTVRVKGAAPHLHSPEVGFIFQEPRLLPWLTVADNVGFDAGPGGGRNPRVKELLAEVGLADFANAYPKQLSGGMAQRAAIARGLFAQPSLLLVTHDIDEAAYLSDRILVMSANPGRIAGELRVDPQRPRDRADSRLVRVQTQALALLHGERLDYLDLSDELAARPHAAAPVDFASLSFAV